MCDHNCNECKTPCALSKIAPKLSKAIENNNIQNDGKEKEKMALGSCNSGNEEKIARLDERTELALTSNQNCRPFLWVAFSLIALNLILLFVLAICFQSQLSNIRLDIRDSQKDVSGIKNDISEIRILSLDAQRGYNNARKTLSRIRKNSND